MGRAKHMHCDQQDYIEIACTFRLPVRLTLRTGEQCAGQAVDTCYNDRREECLRLATDSGQRVLPLAALAVMEALTENPHFRCVRFD